MTETGVALLALLVVSGAGFAFGFLRWRYLLVPGLAVALVGAAIAFFWWDASDCLDCVDNEFSNRTWAWIGTLYAIVLGLGGSLFASFGWVLGRAVRDH